MSGAGELLTLASSSKAGLIALAKAVRAGAPPPPPAPGDDFRLAVIAEDGSGLGEGLALALERLGRDDKTRFNLANRVFYGRAGDTRDARRTAFLFPGFGAHHPTMVADLLAAFPTAQAWFNGLPAGARARFEANPLLFPTRGEGVGAGFAETIDAVLLGSLAMVEVVGHICPDVTCEAMAGHSYGETAVLLAAGMVAEPGPVFDLLRRLVDLIAAADADALGTATGTAMLALNAAARPVLTAFSGRADAPVAALDNCPQQTIYCGRREIMAELEARLRAAGGACFRLPELCIPVHTPLFPVPEAALAGLYADMALSPPRLPAYSCVGVAPFPTAPDAIRAELAAQWSRPVRFRETIERLHHDGIRTFVEVGPGGNLTGFVRDTLRGKDALAIATNLESRGTLAQLRCFAAQMFVRGHAINAESLRAAPTEPTKAVRPAPVGDIGDIGGLKTLLRRLVAEIMEFDSPDQVEGGQGFFDLGMGSLQAVDLIERVQAELGRPLAQTLAFDHPSIDALAAHLGGVPAAKPAAAVAESGDGVAIIGLGCRLPGGIDGPEAFWDVLRRGGDAIADIPDGRWDLNDFAAAGIDPAAMPHIFRGGFLDEIRDFDCAFFGISPREAITLDPQQRLLLEVSREALEHAAIPPASLKGSATGIFVGISNAEYAQRLSMAERLAIAGYIGTGNAHSTAAGRLSFVMGLNGPCLAVDTACSSSLVAVHLACQSLRRGESRLALAAGVNLLVSPETSIFLSRAGALAADSRCKTFDDRADGYVRSEGCGVVVLKRLAEALADGDRVLAVIRGSAVNHDGRTSGFTVPNGPAQQAVLRLALADSGLDPDEVDYVEAHGTGTALGDPIEVHALGEVFAGRPDDRPVVLGALKTNVGHLEAAAGIAGLIKVVLQLGAGEIAPSLHQTKPNARIGWDHLPLAVAGSLQPWPARGRPRAAGISSFGISGTNAHVVLEQAPLPVHPAGAVRRHHVLALSARSPAALEVLRRDAVARLDGGDFADLCATSILGRDHLPHRLAVVAADAAEAGEALARCHPAAQARRPKLAFVFAGQGAQHAGMGRGLFADEPVFRAAVEECEALLRPLLDRPITEIMFGGTGLNETIHTQPALFTLEYALVRLWRSWGVTPDLVLGHSVGEYAAAAAAGMLDLADALRLVAARGRLMQSLPSGGAMLAVALGEAEAAAFVAEAGLDLDLDIAAINGRQSAVLSGSAGAVDRARAALEAKAVRVSPLAVSHAFHSRLMDPILAEFRRLAGTMIHRAPTIALARNLDGRITQEPLDAAYWTDQLRRPVRFADGIAALRAQGAGVFLEIGPRPVLTGMAKADGAEGCWLAGLHPPAEDQRQSLTALAGLHLAGIEVDWAGFQADRGWRPASLPPTPFERQRLWLDRTAGPAQAIRVKAPVSPAPSAPSPTYAQRLLAAPAAERADLAAYLVRRMVASVLGGANPDALDSADPLNRLGLDSLMALGLRNEMASEFGVDVSLARLTGDESLNSLAAEVLDHMGASTAAPEKAEGDGEIAPLSYGQRALWFLWDLAPDSSAYNLSLPLRLKGPVSRESWRAACRALSACHPLLRTVFPRRDGEVTQRVLPAGEVDWQAADASAWTGDELDRAKNCAHAQPFDLERGPVARYRWFDLADGGALLLISLHHIVADGWSLELIRRQLPRLAAGEDMAAAPGYHRFVRAQAALLAGPEGERLWRYWQTRLAGSLPLLDLPTDFPRPAVKSYRGDGVAVEFPTGLGTQVRALAAEAGATPYVVYLAGFLALLHRYTGQDDVVAGSPQAGRDRPELAGLVGYFVDPLVIRSTLDPTMTVRDFIARTRQSVLDGLDHAAFPFALLVERLRPQRDPSRSPLFDASFNFTPALPECGGDVPVVAELSQADGKFDLTLNLTDGPEPCGWFGFDTALFRSERIGQIGQAFIAVLRAMVEQPERPLVDLPLAPGGGFAPALAGRRLAVGGDDLVHRRIAAQAAHRPDAPAVVAPDGALSYAQLDRRAGRFAARLRNQGVGPGTLVGLPAVRTCRFIVAMLGIHRAGGAFVPLDPGWPEGLLQDVVTRTGIHPVLTTQDLEAEGPDEDGEGGGDDPAGPGDLAYVMFTSGSTGIPKGVAVEHRALANYVASMTDDLGLAAGGHYALASTLAADLGLTMVFPALAGGGCLHLLPEAACLEPEAFADYLLTRGIDYLKIVPSHLAALSTLRPVLPRRVLVLGGEVAQPAWVEGLRRANPQCRIVNHYGPTETTIGVMTGAVEPNDTVPDGAGLALRRVVANAEIYLLDRHGAPVPPGAIGEVHVAGAGLARGYVGQPEQSAAAFVTIAGRRLYRTGDLARQAPDGAITIVGRRDRQVKIRGFRIEPGQVEAVLAGLPGVAQAAVVPDGDGAGAARLLAFAVMAADEGGNELRRQLAERLPAQMVPDHVMVIDALPRNANGKTDVAALRQLAGDGHVGGRVPSLPRDGVELDLARLWSEVLGVADLGIGDDFFQSGGHSLLAVRLLARVQQHFGRRISLSSLLTHPTIERLAEVLRALPGPDDHPALVSLRGGGESEPLFLLPGAGGSLMYFVPLIRALAPGRPVWGFQALGLGQDEAIPERVEDIARRYVELIDQCRPEGAVHLAGHSFGALVAFEMAAMLRRQGRPPGILALIDNPAPDSNDVPPRRSDGQWLRHIAVRIAKLTRTPLELDDFGPDEDYDGQVETLVRRLAAAGLLPAGLGPGYFTRFIAVYKANAIAAAEYRPARSPAWGEVAVLRATAEDSDLDAAGARGDPALGWGRLVDGPVRPLDVPGTHLTMFAPPHVGELARRLGELLDDWRPRPSEEITGHV